MSRALHAAGFLVTRLDCAVELNPMETAKRLAGFLKGKDAQVILCGAQAGYGDSGLVPYILANALGVEIAPNAASVSVDHGKGGERLSFSVEADGDLGKFLYRMKPPFLAAMGNSPLALRQSTLKAQLLAGKRKAAVEHAPAYEETRDLVFFEEKSERKAKRIESSDVAQELLGLIESLAQQENEPGVQPQAEPKRGRQGKAALLLGPGPGMSQSLARMWGLAEGDAQAELWAECSIEEAFECPQGIKAAKLVDVLSQSADMLDADFAIADGSVAATKAAVALAIKKGWQIEGCVLESDGARAVSRVCSSHVKREIPLGKNYVLIASPQARKVSGWKRGEPELVDLRTGNAPELDASPLEAALGNPLESAKLLLVGGVGLGSAESFASLQRLAKLLGGAAGLTRAAAMAGYGPMELVVGQSGKSSAPKVCVLFGSSGASAFMSGIERAGAIIAVNILPSAAVFDKSDYGFAADAPSLVADCVEVLSGRGKP
jgi:electron transfer flavoprotein alpha subunit